jgi:hypothetical protein
LRKVDKDTILASIEAQGFIELLGPELVALAEYQRWRAAFDAGQGTLEMPDGQHKTRGELAARLRAKRQGKLKGLYR